MLPRGGVAAPRRKISEWPDDLSVHGVNEHRQHRPRKLLATVLEVFPASVKGLCQFGLAITRRAARLSAQAVAPRAVPGETTSAGCLDGKPCAKGHLVVEVNQNAVYPSSLSVKSVPTVKAGMIATL